jgi:hypothetical protein
MRKLRIHLALAVAKLLRVPVTVGYSFIALGKKPKKPTPGSLI